MGLSNDIEKLREQYEQERQRTIDVYTKNIEDAKIKLEEYLRYDYAKDYVDIYTESLNSLEKVYLDWSSIQNKTRGLNFYMDEYIKKLKPNTIEFGKVEEFFYNLVNECRQAIISVQNSRTIEDDIAPQKIFCQHLTDLRYIVENARVLIDDTGLPQSNKKEKCEPLEQNIKDWTPISKGNFGLEFLKCSGQINTFKNKLLKTYNQIESELVGSEQKVDCDYNFLMGFTTEKISNENMKFAKEVMGVPEKVFAISPIYFSPKIKNGSVVIKSPRKYFETEEFLHYLTNVYFSFASKLPTKCLLLAGIEKTADAVVRSLASKVSANLGSNYIFGDNIASDSREIENLVKSLMAEFSRRSNIYRSLDDVANVFEYNDNTPDNKHPMIVCMINNYPFGFEGINQSVISDIKTLMERGSDKGIFVVLCESEDSSVYKENTPMINPDEVKADVIEILDELHFYNGKEFVTDITVDGFKPSTYWATLKEEMLTTSASVSLNKLLEKFDERTSKLPHFSKGIKIPIGNCGGEWFDFDLKSCSTQNFALFTGNSGSGKSSFLHTLILSACYCYAPDELQFYLVDFKDKDNSPEFANYLQNGENNLFIPHIRYLSIKSKLESALDLLNKIEIMISDRSKQMRKLKVGVSDVSVYNSSQEVLSGKLPKIPQVYFIIDEYKTMLEGGADSSNSNNYMIIDKISSKLQLILLRARAFGIGIFLSGQDIASGIRGTSLAQIASRISLNMGSDKPLREIFNFGDIGDSLYYSNLLIEKGNALVSTDGGNSFKLVRIAYSGKTGGEQQLNIARRIREKYENNPACNFTQVEAGSEELCPIIMEDAFEKGDFVSFDSFEEDKYYLPLGVSSASSLKISLCFSQNKNNSNYLAFANESRLFAIERNTLLAYLNKNYSGAKAYYCSTATEKRNFIAPYQSVKNVLEDNISFITNKTEIARKLIELSKLYNSRLIQAENEDVDFSPILMVLHDVEWILDVDSNPLWLPQNSAPAKTKKKPISQEQKMQQQSDADIFASLGLDLGDIPGLSNAIASAPVEEIETVEIEETNEIFTVEDVKNALNILHKKANQCGIFLLICSVKPSPIDTMLSSDRDGICKDYIVYGSFEMMTQNRVIASEGSNCIYVCPSGSKIRMFDYSPDLYGDWWKNLEAKLSKE